MDRLSEITTLASNIKKPTKQDMHDRLKDKIVHGEIDDTTLAMLYSFFMPVSTKKKKSSPDWVKLAVSKSKKDPRRQLTKLYSDGSRLIGCDGHRLHIYKMPEPLEQGYYDNALTKIDDMGRYPDIDQVTVNPEFALEDVTISELNVSEVGEFVCYQFPNGKYYNKKYIDDARNTEDKLRVRFNDMGVAQIETENTIAVVMPVNS